jgi:hypothetical protein
MLQQHAYSLTLQYLSYSCSGEQRQTQVACRSPGAERKSRLRLATDACGMARAARPDSTLLGLRESVAIGMHPIAGSCKAGPFGDPLLAVDCDLASEGNCATGTLKAPPAMDPLVTSSHIVEKIWKLGGAGETT